MLEKLDNSNDDILLFLIQILIWLHFLAMIWVPFIVDLNNINLDDDVDNIDEDGPETISHVSLMTYCIIELNNTNHVKK